MNQSDLSEAFGRQIGLLTIGTKYEVDSESNENMDQLEGRIRAIMYNLWMDAQSVKLADFLQRKQAAHFEQLYEFSYGVSMYDQEHFLPKDAESLALRIIDEKQAFVKRNERLKLRYQRFKSIANQLPASSKGIIVNYFEKGIKVDYELLRNTLKEHLKAIEIVYKEDELENEEEADRIEEELLADSGKVRYVINRRIVYMTPEEYEAFLEEEKAQRNKLYEQLGLAMPG